MEWTWEDEQIWQEWCEMALYDEYPIPNLDWRFFD